MEVISWLWKRATGESSGSMTPPATRTGGAIRHVAGRIRQGPGRGLRLERPANRRGRPGSPCTRHRRSAGRRGRNRSGGQVPRRRRIHQPGGHGPVAGDAGRGPQEKRLQLVPPDDPGETLGFDTGQFDAVISIGVFTLGHAPINSFDELVRVTKPGLHRLQPAHRHGGRWLPGLFRQAGVDGRWKLSEVSDPYQPLPKGEPEVFHQIWAFQVA